MRLRKLGHSCLLAAGDGYRLLIDPGCFASGLADVRDLTAVLITHIHDDHLDTGLLQAVLAHNPAARVIADEASAAALAGQGVPAEPVHEGDVLELGATVSVHGREHAVIHPDLPNVPNVGYLIAGRLFCAGDAFTNPGRPVDILAVPGRRGVDEGVRGRRLAARDPAAGRRARARSRQRLRGVDRPPVRRPESGRNDGCDTGRRSFDRVVRLAPDRLVG